MLNVLNRIEQPAQTNAPQNSFKNEAVFPIQKNPTKTFQNTMTELPADFTAASRELEHQESIIKQKAGVLKMITDVLEDPENTGKSARIANLAKRMSAFELASLMQQAENQN